MKVSLKAWMSISTAVIAIILMRSAPLITSKVLDFSPYYHQPSHHIPLLYALAGAAYKTQERVHEIAKANYNNTPTGLSGVHIIVFFLSINYLYRSDYWH
jgi:putative alpha-1,2-mannosidase